MAVRKQRLDKYYHLAKEKGYRARSAFKLLELNRKYGLLKDANIAVDLCAAPGGWMQILAQEMPPARKIIGVDLDPIKPLGSDTVSFVGDITTVECRRTLIGLLDGHQVDIFVHDGAPNFGTSKDKDHFVQNDLVLHALKLTTEFLKRGGSFVTKIFRSENFPKIVKILESLFDYVDVTKPLSSRNESAEIFAVCRMFKDPEYIDPALFDSGVQFCGTEEDEEDDNNYKKILLSDYIRASNNKVLDKCITIVPDFECGLITDEHREMFRDLKVMPKEDFRKLSILKTSILNKVCRGELKIEQLSDLVKEPVLESSLEEESEVVDPLVEIEEKMERIKKKETRGSKGKRVKMPKHMFFDDRLFGDFDSTEYEVASEPEAVEVSSCSDSMEMTESELRCAIYMKETAEDKFLGSTIDRYMADSDDIQLPFEKRPIKMDEPKMEKKKLEVLSRKKARAMRRANKAITDIVVENEEEEAVVYKKMFKNAYKKERLRPRIVFPSKSGRFVAPKGKGKIRCLDKRMKHDLRLERRRQRR